MRSGSPGDGCGGSLLITVLLVLLVEVMFLYSTTRSYYNGVQQTMYRRFSSSPVSSKCTPANEPEDRRQPQRGSAPDGGAVFR